MESQGGWPDERSQLCFVRSLSMLIYGGLTNARREFVEGTKYSKPTVSGLAEALTSRWDWKVVNTSLAVALQCSFHASKSAIAERSGGN